MLKSPTDIELRYPFRPKGGGRFILTEPFYDSCFLMDWRIPLWTLTRYTQGRTIKAWRRDGTPIPLDRGFDSFCANPRLPGSPLGADYAGSGYHTGHMVPAEAMQFDRDALLSSFYTTNACPQRAGLNCGPWRTLESKIFAMAARGLELVVITGPVVLGGKPERLASGVVVPDMFFKVVACPATKTIACWIMPNAEHPDSELAAHRASLDKVAHLTGLRFAELEDYADDTPGAGTLRPLFSRSGDAPATSFPGAGRSGHDGRGLSPLALRPSIKIENLLNGEFVVLERVGYDMRDSDYPGARIVVPAGFRTDFGSVPEWSHWLIEGIGTRRDLVYVLHDLLYASEYFAWEGAYKLIADAVANRRECDLALLEGCKAVGDDWLIRNIIYGAVRFGGDYVWEKHTPESVAAARNLLLS